MTQKPARLLFVLHQTKISLFSSYVWQRLTYDTAAQLLHSSRWIEIATNDLVCSPSDGRKMLMIDDDDDDDDDDNNYKNNNNNKNINP